MNNRLTLIAFFMFFLLFALSLPAAAVKITRTADTTDYDNGDGTHSMILGKPNVWDGDEWQDADKLTEIVNITYENGLINISTSYWGITYEVYTGTKDKEEKIDEKSKIGDMKAKLEIYDKKSTLEYAINLTDISEASKDISYVKLKEITKWGDATNLIINYDDLKESGFIVEESEKEILISNISIKDSKLFLDPSILINSSTTGLLEDLNPYESGAANNNSAQLKWNITQLLVLNISDIELFMYISGVSGTPDNDATFWRIDDQTWTETSSAATLNSQSKTNQTSTNVWSSIASGTWTQLNVTGAVITDVALNNKNSTIRIEDSDSLVGTIAYRADDEKLYVGRYSSLYLYFNSREAISNTPYLNVTYTVTTDTTPKWSLNSTNTTLAGANTTFSVYWNTTGTLQGYIFYWNNGSNWTDGSCGDYATQEICESYGCSWNVGSPVSNTEDWTPTTDYATYQGMNSGWYVNLSSTTLCINDANDDCACYDEDAANGIDNITKQTDIDLSGCAIGTANVTFGKLENAGTLEATDCLKVYFSDDSGSTWGDLTTIGCDDAPFDGLVHSVSIPDAYLVSTFRMRFQGNQEATGGSGEAMCMDNVVIACQGANTCTGTPNYAYKNNSYTTFGGLWNWSNVTKIVNSTVGANISCYVWANNTDGISNQTPIFWYLTTETVASTAYNRAASDVMTMSEAEMRPLVMSRARAEAMQFADADLRSFLGIRKASDVITFVDTVARYFSGQRKSADSMTMADASLRNLKMYRLSSDAVLAVDGSGRWLVMNRQIGDALAEVDAGGRTYGAARPTADTMQISDAQFRQGAFTRQTAAILLFADAALRTGYWRRSASDLISMIDEVNRRLVLPRGASDSFTFQDPTGRTFLGVRKSADTFTFADADGRQLEMTRISTDIFTFIDSAGNVMTAVRTGADTITFVDASGRTLQVNRAVASSMLFADANRKIKNLFREVSDSMIISEAAKRMAAFYRFTADIMKFVPKFVGWHTYELGERNATTEVTSAGGGGMGGFYSLPESFVVSPLKITISGSPNRTYTAAVRSLVANHQEIGLSISNEISDVLVARPANFMLAGYETEEVQLIFAGAEGYPYFGGVTFRSTLGQITTMEFEVERGISFDNLTARFPDNNLGVLALLLSHGNLWEALKVFVDGAITQPLITGLKAVGDIPKVIILAPALIILAGAARKKKISKKLAFTAGFISMFIIFTIPTSSPYSPERYSWVFTDAGESQYSNDNFGAFAGLAGQGKGIEAAGFFLDAALMQPAIGGLKPPTETIPKWIFVLPLSILLIWAYRKKKIARRYAVIGILAVLGIFFAIPPMQPASSSFASAVMDTLPDGNLDLAARWFSYGEPWMATKVFFGSALAQSIAGIPKALIFIVAIGALAYAGWKGKIKWAHGTLAVFALLFVLFVIPSMPLATTPLAN